MKSKSFIYRGFEIIENPNSFNIYHENDELLKIIPKDNKKSFKVVETFINEYLRMKQKPIWIKAKNFNGFNVGDLIKHLKTIPKNKRVVLNTPEGEEPLNNIQESYFKNNSILLNSFYEDEF